MALTQDWREERLLHFLSPGRRLELLPKWLAAPKRGQVMRCAVLCRQEGDLVLSPPRPSLPQPALGRPLEITFLSQDRKGSRRYGYYSLVLDTLDDFSFKGSPRPGVVVLFPRKQDIAPIDLRQSRRFVVAPGGFLNLEVKGLSGVQLLDISLTGLRFRHGAPGSGPVRNDRLALNLLIDDQAHGLRGQVVGVRLGPGGSEVSVELSTLALNVRTALIQVLREMESYDPGHKEI
jgi:hypothetical protein